MNCPKDCTEYEKPSMMLQDMLVQHQWPEKILNKLLGIVNQVKC